MQILKFGGSSVSSQENIDKVVEIIKTKLLDKEIAVVVSAFGGITDTLIESAKLASAGKSFKNHFSEIEKRHKAMAHSQKSKDFLKKTLDELRNSLEEIKSNKKLRPEDIDLITSFGERLSSFLISEYLVSQGIEAEPLDARSLIKTDSNFNNARVNFEESNKNIRTHFQKNKKLQVITGFIASNNKGFTTTLGRGGSDYSASIFGAALKVEKIEIWTDVDGIMTTDPRIVKNALSIAQISYLEAMEMSYFGAKVIHPPTMRPAMQKNIPIVIRNTFNPSFPGSIISKSSSNTGKLKGLSSIKNISLLSLTGSSLIGIPGTSQRLFSTIAKENVNVILISQASSEHSICFAIKSENSDKVKKAVDKEFENEIKKGEVNPLETTSKLAIIAAVGEKMKKLPGISAKLFEVLGFNNININAIAQGSSEVNISVVIKEEDLSKALNSIHENFFINKHKTLNLFLIGPGLIGSTLLQQIEEHCTLKETQQINIKLTAIANSKKMLFSEEGLKIKNCKKDLEKSGEKNELPAFIEKMKAMNKANSIFVDCSTSQKVADLYPQILNSGISIVTANKKANSSDLSRYLKLSLSAANSNAKFLYETNVGAGLPIISTIKDIVFSGDEIIKIEAVLSGTLSYIFNSFTGEKSFSEIVKQAQENGFTEPDPRDDLNGLDVARKMLILAREMGLMLELEDIEVENLVPEDCRQSKNLEEFFKKLEKNNDFFEKKKLKAKKEKKKLCYIGKIENSKAKVSLEFVDEKHPFYSLSGSDNIISLTTKRYLTNPLVIKGPGAGAQVTAAGVFADIIKIAHRPCNQKLKKTSFLTNLKKGKLQITLIGMSNIGKTTWSKKLNSIGFEHIDCDQMIEDKLGPQLSKLGYKGISDVSKWMGQPYEKNFKKTSEQYLILENEVMLEVLKENSKTNKNTVIDTTGSIIYTDKNIRNELRQNSLVVYLEASPDMRQQMCEDYFSNPKPVLWGDCFKQEKGKSPEEALQNSYPKLLKTRENLYEQMADVKIPAKELWEKGFNTQDFIKLIEEKI